MKTVGVDNDISIEEPIRFVLETRDSNDCLIAPYRVDSVTVYFVTREFTDATANKYHMLVQNDRIVSEYSRARDMVCAMKKASVAAATTHPIELSGLQTVDGITLDSGVRVLVKDQVDPVENGIYSVSSGVWSRTEDGRSFLPRSYMFVEEGIANIGSGWYLEAGGVVVVGSTPMRFVRFSENGDPPSPDQYSEASVSELRRMASESSIASEFHYKGAVVVKKFGGNTDSATGEFYPSWLNPAMVPSDMKDAVMGENILSQVYEGDVPVDGRFELVWDPSGCREGDYFICWTWRPTLSAETASAHLYFSLGGGVGITSSIPTHRTDLSKYNMLLERYTPEMFKSLISSNDLTPLVMKGLNESVAAGFTMLENLANQIIDLLDANATHEQLLPLLANIFSIKAKSSDPTLWRRQIKKAIPNFKKKGTIVGLKEAFGDAGMRLLRLSRLWQVVSKYTFQEHFVYEGIKTFKLSQSMILPLDLDFELWFRPSGGDWSDVTSSASSLAIFDGSSVTWNGPISAGDSFRVFYKTREIPSSRRSVEDYIRTLPLMDTRDERRQEYPPKNWNVRVIEEDDPMFGAVVPVRHPISDPVIWGRIRTEFPYGENAYNMDEYNGSKRESLNPCDIDKEFVDSCGGCQGSVYIIDLEIEGLSDGGFEEAVKIAEEYMPFHAMVHTFNLGGSVTEFFGPAEERIEALVNISGGETLIAGEAQHIFNKDVDASQIADVKRDILAGFVAVQPPSGTSWTGTIRNSRICLFPSTSASVSEINDPAFRGLTQGFDSYNINTSQPSLEPWESGNLLELLGTSTRHYSISSIGPSAAEIIGDVDPSVVGPLFEYRISNRVSDITVNITQADRVLFSDEEADFYLMGIVTQKDVDDGNSAIPAWTIRFQSSEYEVLDLLPDGSLLLDRFGDAPTSSGWELWSAGQMMRSGPGGLMNVQNFGLVEVPSPPSIGVRSLVRPGDYLYLGWPSSPVAHRIRSYRAGEDSFYIEGWSGGDTGGVQAKVYRRVMESKIGQIGYDGLELEADLDLESLLPVSDGALVDTSNINSSFLRDNYLIFMGSEYYTISSVDGSRLILGGNLGSYGKNGVNVEFTVYRFSKAALSIRERASPRIPGFDFDFVDRSGKALISVSQAIPFAGVFSHALNHANSGRPFDVAGQEEGIEMTVEYRDGENK